MTISAFPLLIAYTLSFFISLGVGIYVWQRRNVVGGTSLAIIILAQASWTFGLIVETSVSGLNAKIFWDNFQFIGWLSAIAAFIPFTLELTANRTKSPKRLWTAVMLIPLISTILAYTDPIHHLIRPTVELIEENGLISLYYPFPFTMYALAAFTYIVMLVAMGILVRHAFISREKERNKALIILAGFAIPFIGGVLSILEYIPPALRDISPFTFGATNLILTYGFARYRIFDLMPIAREKILEGMDSPILVLDEAANITFANPAAMRVFNLQPDIIGKPAPETIKSWSASAGSQTNKIITVEIGNETLFFELKVEYIYNTNDALIGRTIILTDITHQKQIQEQLVERTHLLEKQSAELEMRSEELKASDSKNAHRAALLETVSDVARYIAAIQDFEALLPSICETISSRFGFYHVGIFLVDNNKQYAILSGTNSDGGKRMMERGHRLEVGQKGIVGYVTGSGRSRIALDTGDDAVFFDNPDLPDTRSEVALPLIVGNNIIGALDVQSTKPNAFTEEDVRVLTTLANQVTVAIQNARSFEETKRSLAEANAVFRQNIRQDWKRKSEQSTVVGFQYAGMGATPLAKQIDRPEIKDVVQNKKDIVVSQEQEQGNVMAVPLKLRDEVIGVLNVRVPGNREWRPHEIDLAKAVADRVAISAENARLFEETTNRAERERLVADITNKIRSTNDPQEMMRIAQAELQQALGAKKVNIAPYDPNVKQNQPEAAKKTKKADKTPKHEAD